MAKYLDAARMVAGFLVQKSQPKFYTGWTILMRLKQATAKGTVSMDDDDEQVEEPLAPRASYLNDAHHENIDRQVAEFLSSGKDIKKIGIGVISQGDKTVFCMHCTTWHAKSNTTKTKINNVTQHRCNSCHAGETDFNRG